MAARSWQAFVERPETQPGRATGRLVTLTAARPGLAELQVGEAALHIPMPDPAIGQLSWGSVLELALATAFLERPVCLVSNDPPLEWGDIDLEALGAPPTTLQHGDQLYTLVSLAAATQPALAVVARSQDFLHGTLRVAAETTTAEQVQRFLTTLREAGALYPPWEDWVRIDPRQAAQVFEAERERKLRGGQEFMECNHDGDVLYWFHPPAEALERYAQALRDLAETRDLRFRTEIV